MTALTASRLPVPAFAWVYPAGVANRQLPVSGVTLIFSQPGTVDKGGIIVYVLVTLGAGAQDAFPDWLATILTKPVAAKARFVPPVIVPMIALGPLLTAKVTGKPEDACALNPTLVVPANTEPLTGIKFVIT